jgi:hypothetical protein
MCNNDLRAYTRRTKAHGPSSRPLQAWERFIKELKNILSRERPTFEAIQYALPNDKDEMRNLRWEEQIKILGDDDTDEDNTCYSNFSFKEGRVWVPEEEAEPEEDPLLEYYPEEDMFVYVTLDKVDVVGRPGYDSNTLGTFCGCYCSLLLNFEDEILIRRGDCNNPDPLSRVE